MAAVFENVGKVFGIALRFKTQSAAGIQSEADSTVAFRQLSPSRLLFAGTDNHAGESRSYE